jgi:type IX secretion system PorP/SprF family membrane protein
MIKTPRYELKKSPIQIKIFFDMNKIFTIIALLLTLISISFSQKIYAQQEVRYSQYMFNGLVINPAYAGTGDRSNLTLFARKQWVNIEWAPFSASGSFHTALGKSDNHGVGAYTEYDKIGVHNRISLYGTYAYRIPVGKVGRLGIGLSAGATYLQSNWADVTTVEGDDPLFAVNESGIAPNFGVGLYFSTPNFYIGASVPQMLDVKLVDSGVTFDIAKQHRHYYGTAGVVIPLSKSFKLVPSGLVKIVPNYAPTQIDANLSLLIKDALWLGSSFRFAAENDAAPESVNAIVAFQFNNGMRIGYAYDLTLSDMSQFTSGSHEITLSFDFGKADVGRFKTPRYF